MSHKILLGITGGIAAYKSPEVVRLLIKKGHQVRCVMTQSARSFVTPLTLQAVSQQPIAIDLLDPEAERGMPHIELARWPDLFLIAPASANTLAKCAHGLADDLLSTLYLATQAPILIAPAMNQNMWTHPSTQRNIAQLRADGAHIIPPDSGEQACGDIGIGRLAPPECLVQHSLNLLTTQFTDFSGLKIVITAGPTQEPLDPVRYLTNKSSGKMGYALAKACSARGAQVILVSGPTQLACPAGVKRLNVTTAEEMLNCAKQHAHNCDIFIGVAAVSDFKALTSSTKKIKRPTNQATYTIECSQNPDILQTIKTDCQPKLTVGFAAETHNMLKNARDKLKRKKLDVIIANDVSFASQGFNSDQNAVTVLTDPILTQSDKAEISIPCTDKVSLANMILDHLRPLLPTTHIYND